jgi:hypothetical protein
VLYALHVVHMFYACFTYVTYALCIYIWYVYCIYLQWEHEQQILVGLLRKHSPGVLPSRYSSRKPAKGSGGGGGGGGEGGRRGAGEGEGGGGRILGRLQEEEREKESVKEREGEKGKEKVKENEEECASGRHVGAPPRSARDMERQRDFLADMLARMEGAAGGGVTLRGCGRAGGEGAVKRELKGLVQQLVASYEQVACLRCVVCVCVCVCACVRACARARARACIILYV